MKTFQKVVLAIALAIFILMLWKMDRAEVFHHISQVGWGIFLILGQEIVAHVFNALGWRYAFPREETGFYPFVELLKLRVVGDGVNYLTPSGTIAGEFIRAILLNDSRPTQVRYTSVTVAKLSQAVAQIVFIFIGLLAVLGGAAPALAPYRRVLLGLAALIAVVMAAFSGFCVWLWLRIKNRLRPEVPGTWLASLGSMPYQCLRFIRHHPLRFTYSLAWFVCGYAWGGFEAYWICRYLGTPVTVTVALVIEAFSNLVDCVMFMVPAKIGTQELGKTAIFAALRMKPSAGFAFGLVRHFREVAWGGAGLLLYSTYKKRGLSVSKEFDSAQGQRSVDVGA